MIRIHKSPQIPKPLDGPRSRGGKATARLVAKFEAGEREFKFDSEIYGHHDVREASKTDQSRKCVFCEARFAHVGYGDVEHFRPKGGFQQTPDGELERPGYFWLAYRWDNLSLSCQLCNQAFKRNLFPLLNPAERARSHQDDIAREQPVLVNPLAEDPSKFIDFREEVAFGEDTQLRGSTTINAVGLNDPDRLEARREALVQFRDSWNTLKAAEASCDRGLISSDELPDLQQIRARLLRRAERTAEYSAMFRSELRRLGVPI